MNIKSSVERDSTNKLVFPTCALSSKPILCTYVFSSFSSFISFLPPSFCTFLLFFLSSSVLPPPPCLTKVLYSYIFFFNIQVPAEDETYDAIYEVEATCHAPDKVGIYTEIKRLLKPGQLFAGYEWIVTDKYPLLSPPSSLSSSSALPHHPPLLLMHPTR